MIRPDGDKSPESNPELDKTLLDFARTLPKPIDPTQNADELIRRFSSSE